MLSSSLALLARGMLVLLPALSLWAAAPQFRLRDTKGAVHASTDWVGAKAILLFFVTNDCPVTNSYVPEMNRIQEAYATRGVRSYAVQADVSVPVAAVAEYARDFRYQFPLLLDSHQLLVKVAGATVTPQAVVLSPDGKVLYRGRIDNRVEDFGSQRTKATVNDLRVALDAILSGKPAPVPVTKSIGCAITRIQ